MSGNGNNRHLTFGVALAAFGEKQSGHLAYDYFNSRDLLNQTSQNSQKWTDPNVYNHLQVIYKKLLIGLHPDKRGSGCTETFMLVREAWLMLKGRYTCPIVIDLTLNSDTDNDDDDDDDAPSIDSRNDDAKEDESEEDEHQEEDGQDDVVVGSDRRTNEQSSEHDQTTGGMLAVGTVQPFAGKPSSEFDKMIGRRVKKIYWFKGVIVKIKDVKVGGELPCLYHVEYDDNDWEELTLDELGNLTRDDDCDMVIGNIGYTFWKGFPLTGKVTKIHYAQHDGGGKTMSCSC